MRDNPGKVTGVKHHMSVLAVMRSEDHVEHVREAFAELGVKLEVRVNGIGHVPVTLSNSRAPDMLLFDIEPENPTALEQLSRVVKDAQPSTTVVATAAGATVDSVRRVMRVGVVDFIPQPLTRNDIMGALQASAARRLAHIGEAGRKGCVISFVHACGGVGATTLAVETALELVRRQKKKAEDSSPVCLADLDLQFGNVSIALDVQGKFGLMQALEAKIRMDGAFLRGAVSRHASGLDVLTAPGRIVALDTLTREFVGELIDIAREEYESLVIDLPHACADWTLEVLARSDAIVLVCELNVSAIYRVRHILELLNEEGLADVPTMVVANRFNKDWGYGTRLKTAESALGRSIDCFVRFDSAASEARDKGVPIRDVKRGSKVEKDVGHFLNLVQKKLAPRAALRPVLSAS